MLGDKASLEVKNSFKSPAQKLMERENTSFAPKAKGSVLNSTPVIDPALKALAFNRRKKVKIG